MYWLYSFICFLILINYFDTNDIFKQLVRNITDLDFLIIYSIDEVRKTKEKTNWIKFTHKYWQKIADLVLYQKIERAITNNPTIQLDVNKDGDNLNLASETAEYQSPNENFQVAFYDQITQFKMAILADSALIQFNRKQTKNLFCFLNVHCIKLLLHWARNDKFWGCSRGSSHTRNWINEYLNFTALISTIDLDNIFLFWSSQKFRHKLKLTNLQLELHHVYCKCFKIAPPLYKAPIFPTVQCALTAEYLLDLLTCIISNKYCTQWARQIDMDF